MTRDETPLGLFLGGPEDGKPLLLRSPIIYVPLRQATTYGTPMPVAYGTPMPVDACDIMIEVFEYRTIVVPVYGDQRLCAVPKEWAVHPAQLGRELRNHIWQALSRPKEAP